MRLQQGERMEKYMILKNGTVLTEEFVLKQLDVRVENGVIAEIGENLSGDDVLDCAGCTVVPGFVDVHTHGAMGADTCDADAEGLQKIADHMLSHGVTSFCPTTMTVSHDEIVASLKTVREFAAKQTAGAAAVGVHLEGPYIAKARKGAQAEEYVKVPDFEEFKEFYAASGEMIRIVSVAPECDDSGFIENAAKLCTVSIAHTTADYDIAMAAFDKGVTHATHLYNAMNGLNHRNPGVVGAVFDDERVAGELICDGFHIHPAALRIAFKQLAGRVCVVSDSMRAAGLSDGEYDLGGQNVTVKGKTALLADGTIAGSVSNLHEELKNLVSYGVPLETAVRAMTETPAREIGLYDRIGSVAVGKKADLVVLDKDLDIVTVLHEN